MRDPESRVARQTTAASEPPKLRRNSVDDFVPPRRRPRDQRDVDRIARRPDAKRYAALVESLFPSVGNRLTTTVEWPGIRRTAELARVSKRVAERTLQHLVDAGLVSKPTEVSARLWCAEVHTAKASGRTAEAIEATMKKAWLGRCRYCRVVRAPATITIQYDPAKPDLLADQFDAWAATVDMARSRAPKSVPVEIPDLTAHHTQVDASCSDGHESFGTGRRAALFSPVVAGGS